MADQLFGREILEIRADDKQLADTLKKDQAQIADFASKGQADLNQLAATQARWAAGVSVASAAVSTLAAAAGATGNKTLQMGAAIAGIIPAVGGLTVAMQAFGISAAAVAAPIAIITAGVAALAAVVLALTGNLDAAVQKFTDWFEGVDEGIERNKAQDKQLKEEVAARKKVRDAVQDQIDILKGLKDATDLIADEKLRGLTIELNDLKEAKRLETERLTIAQRQADEEARREQTQFDRNQALRQELAVLRGIAKATDFIADDEERSLTITRNKLIEEKREAEEARRAAEAAARITGQPRRTGAGSIELSAFASSGAGRGIAIAMDPREELRRRQERKRTDNSDEQTRLLQRIADGRSGGALP